MKALEARCDHTGDLSNRQVALRRQQPLPARVHPFAGLVELSDHSRAHVVAPVVQVLLELVLHHLALFLDDEDLFQPLGEFTNRIRLQRPRHRDFQHPDADALGFVAVDPELFQSFQHIAVGLARRDDAESRGRRIDRHAIEPIGSRIGDGRIDLVVLH
jgi:hypothetical protein